MIIGVTKEAMMRFEAEVKSTKELEDLMLALTLVKSPEAKAAIQSEIMQLMYEKPMRSVV